MDVVLLVWSLVCGYVVCSALLFFFPGLLHKKKMLPFKCQHISHRGGGGENLENTMTAFKHAADVGTDMFELDCQITKDGFVVVSHDDCLERVTGCDVKISETNYTDLPLLKPNLELASDFGYVHITKGSGDRKIVLLRDLFSAFPNMPMNIDIKENDDETIHKVNELIVEFERTRITIWGNKTATITEKCYQANPEIPIIFSIERLYALIIYFYLGLLPFVPIKESCFEIPIPRMYLKKKETESSVIHELKRTFFFLMLDLVFLNRFLFFHLKRRGVQILFWVINTDDEYVTALYYNVSGIMTDFPTKFREKMDARVG